MKRIAYSVVAFATLAAGCDSLAFGEGRIAEVTIVDRDTGAVLPSHYYRGEYWIAGRPGGHYGIEIRNRLDGGRVLVVGSVDGVNVVSGETAMWDQTGYVLRPREAYQITGWRKSDVEVAAFTFTESPNSYAELTGRPANVGVIGVAVFLERQTPREAPAARAPAPHPLEFGKPNKPQSEVTVTGSPSTRDTTMVPTPVAAMPPIAGGLDTVPVPPIAGGLDTVPVPPITGGLGAVPVPPASRSEPVPTPSDAAVPSSPLSGPVPAPPPKSALEASTGDVRQSEPLSPKLGTGHGEREYSYVVPADFTRRQERPNEVIRFRYDSYNNLVAMGIIPRPRPRIPAVDPFPGGASPQFYVPDPPSAGMDDLR